MRKQIWNKSERRRLENSVFLEVLDVKENSDIFSLGFSLLKENVKEWFGMEMSETFLLVCFCYSNGREKYENWM